MFSKNLNRIVGAIAVCVVLTCATAVGIYFYYFTPEYSRVGYQPLQEVSFSHKTHAGELMIDCRYCHYLAEQGWCAGIPEASICMNCHNQVLTKDSRLESVRKSVVEGKPLFYKRIYRTPDYVWFNHQVHIRRGVACAVCHGNVEEMEMTFQAKSQSMKFCLDCHRNPAVWIVPLQEVTKPIKTTTNFNLVKQWNIKTSDECSQCHR
ncbi:MAG: cytochrome c3 family protein [Verrucomicrobiia bacterium]